MNDERNLGEKTDDSGQQPRYEHYQFHEEQGTVLKPSGPSGHRRNQNSFQKKAGTTIALAVIWPGGGSCISGGEFCSRQIPEYR